MPLPRISPVNAALTAAGALALSACAATPTGPDGNAPDVILHSGANYSGASLPVSGPIPDLVPARFNDDASSISIQYGSWEVCEDADFRGRCEVLSASEPDLQRMRLNDSISSIRPMSGGPYTPAPTPAPGAPYGAGLVFYSDDNLRGSPLTVNRDEPDLGRLNYNDRAESVEVTGGVWSVCTDDGYRGRCATVDRTVTDLSTLGLSQNISSVRQISGSYDPAPAPGYPAPSPAPSPTGQGYPGEQTVFYPAPLRGGVRVNNYGNAANEFCRDEGYGQAVYFNQGPVLSDVLCR